jgi:L-type amino acid transporter 5
LTAINCYNVKWGTNLQTIFTATKILALFVIIIAGLIVMCLGMGKSENLEDPFEGTKSDPGSIALAFYSGLFSFAGWNYLNFVTEELKDPFRYLFNSQLLLINYRVKI